MSEMNALHNRIVWADIPVVDLDRTAIFYAAVLSVKVHKERFNDFAFGILDHVEGNGGCLVPTQSPINSSPGILLYMNVDKRIKDAVIQTEKLGGKILEPIHPIGPHGFRAIVLGSEGNRIALHSTLDT